MTKLKIKIDKALKAEVSAVLDDMGLDVTTAVNMFFKEIVRIKGQCKKQLKSQKISDSVIFYICHL